MFADLMPPLNDPLLAVALVAVGGLLWTIASGDRPRSRPVTRRQIEARRRAVEREIEEIGRRTREQIIEAAERYRRDASG